MSVFCHSEKLPAEIICDPYLNNELTPDCVDPTDIVADIIFDAVEARTPENTST